MAQSFHFEDTPPQAFLDSLHKIDVPKIYDPALTSEQRANLINLVHKRLKEWQVGLQEQIEKIKKRHGSGKSPDAELQLAPYLKINELGDELKKNIVDLNQNLKAGRVLPKGFQFGTEIFGDFERQEWRFGERADAKRFEEMVKITNRLEHVQDDLKPMTRDLKLTQARVKEQKADAQILMSKYKRRKSPLNLLLIWLVPILVMIACLAVGYIVFNSEIPYVQNDMNLNPIVGGAFLVIGLVASMMLIVLYRRRKRALEELREDIRAIKQLVQEAEKDFKRQRLEYYPVEKLYAQLKGDYQRLRATFPKE